MPIFSIGRIGTKDVTIEKAEDEKMACLKAGWLPEWCRVRNITGEVLELTENGDLEGFLK